MHPEGCLRVVANGKKTTGAMDGSDMWRLEAGRENFNNGARQSENLP
jgi:hypothetical protein